MSSSPPMSSSHRPLFSPRPRAQCAARSPEPGAKADPFFIPASFIPAGRSSSRVLFPSLDIGRPHKPIALAIMCCGSQHVMRWREDSIDDSEYDLLLPASVKWSSWRLSDCSEYNASESDESESEESEQEDSGSESE